MGQLLQDNPKLPDRGQPERDPFAGLDDAHDTPPATDPGPAPQVVFVQAPAPRAASGSATQLPGYPAAGLGLASLFVGLLSALILGIGVFNVADTHIWLLNLLKMVSLIPVGLLPLPLLILLLGGILAPVGVVLGFCAFFHWERSHTATCFGLIINFAILGLLFLPDIVTEVEAYQKQQAAIAAERQRNADERQRQTKKPRSANAAPMKARHKPSGGRIKRPPRPSGAPPRKPTPRPGRTRNASARLRSCALRSKELTGKPERRRPRCWVSAEVPRPKPCLTSSARSRTRTGRSVVKPPAPLE